jgi:aspartokinase
MPSISQVVRNFVEQRPMVYEGLIEDIISHAALAEYLQNDVERELGKEVKLPAIVMAVRRYSENLESRGNIKNFKFNSEIIMKTGLADVTVVKSPSCVEKLKKLYFLVDYDRGETLNIIHGNYEITIVITEKHLEKLKQILMYEKILNVEKDLVSLSVSFSRDFLTTPGVLTKVTRKLAWENINIFENISTMTELIFIISKKDSVRAYKAVQSLISD